MAKPRPLRPETAPPLREASAALARRTAGVYVSLLVRAVLVGVLWVVLAARLPAFARNRAITDALGALLVVAPFFPAMGKLHAWRTALGRRYLRENRADDAASALAPFETMRARLFDATGEGAFHLALARRAAGANDAERLLSRVATQGQNPWREQASALLGGPDAAPNAVPAVATPKRTAAP